MWLISLLFGVQDNYYTDSYEMEREVVKYKKMLNARKEVVDTIKAYCDGVWGGPVIATNEWKKVLAALRKLEALEELPFGVEKDKNISEVPTMPVRR